MIFRDQPCQLIPEAAVRSCDKIPGAPASVPRTSQELYTGAAVEAGGWLPYGSHIGEAGMEKRSRAFTMWDTCVNLKLGFGIDLVLWLNRLLIRRYGFSSVWFRALS